MFATWNDVVSAAQKSPEKVLRGVTITPTIAQEAVALDNVHNRLVRASTIRRYAAAMTDGNWNARLPQILLLNGDGAVVDGGHRLAAIASLDGQASQGIAFDVYLIETAIGQDEGLRRTLGDFLYMDGVPSAQLAAQVARGLWTSRTAKDQPQPVISALLAFFQENRAPILAAVAAAESVVDGVPPEYLLISKGEIAGLYLRTVGNSLSSDGFRSKMAALLRGGEGDPALKVIWNRCSRLQKSLKRGTKTRIIREIEAAMVA